MPWCRGMNNYMLYTGSHGVYSHTVAYERDPTCVVCSAGTAVDISRDATVQELLDLLLAHSTLGKMIERPSLSVGATMVFGRGIYEQETRPNLQLPVADFLGAEGGVMMVNDKKLAGPLRIRIRFA